MFGFLRQLISRSKSRPRHTVDRCPDCGVGPGELHDLFCLQERCPFCLGQLATCGCIESVLRLSPKEIEALEAAEDDTVPPVSTIMARWRKALDEKGRIPFRVYAADPFRAAYRGDAEEIKSYLDDGLSPRTVNEVGNTLLMSAARGGSVEVIRLLLARGADVHATTKEGFTALHEASGQYADGERQVLAVRTLLDAGADLNAIDYMGSTPLMRAAWFGRISVVKELLRRGANAAHHDTKNRSARDLATERGHQAVADLLP